MKSYGWLQIFRRVSGLTFKPSDQGRRNFYRDKMKTNFSKLCGVGAAAACELVAFVDTIPGSPHGRQGSGRIVLFFESTELLLTF